jgi:excinuclease ABC subunit C
VEIDFKIKNLPSKPGIYQYLNTEGTIIYIGKAKNLKKRVSSYFTKNHDNTKTAVLVKQIADINTIIVNSEIEALLLENNLIKKYQPKYNVLLKDDKTYPWICIKKEGFSKGLFNTKFVKRWFRILWSVCFWQNDEYNFRFNPAVVSNKKLLLKLK